MAYTSSLRLLTLHTLRLKGVAEPEVVAEFMELEPTAVRHELDDLESLDLVERRHGRMGGYAMTPEGDAMGRRLLDDELAVSGVRPDVEAAYGRFAAVNGELLAVCTAWQLRPVGGEQTRNDHTDVAYDEEIVRRLGAVHERITPVLDTLGSALARFAPHSRRLGTALDRVRLGEHDYVAKPMFPSYHTNWFELHEDLLATLGIERAGEGTR